MVGLCEDRIISSMGSAAMKKVRKKVLKKEIKRVHKGTKRIERECASSQTEIISPLPLMRDVTSNCGAVRLSPLRLDAPGW